MSYTVDATDFRAYMVRCEKGLLEAGKSTVRRAAVVAWKAAHETSLFKDRTGRLRESIRLVDGNNEYSANLRAGRFYASYINDGTRAHVIAARKKPLLRFQVGGVWRSAKSVRHPGTRPRPFMSNAEKAGEQFLLSELEREASAAVRP